MPLEVLTVDLGNSRCKLRSWALPAGPDRPDRPDASSAMRGIERPRAARTIDLVTGPELASGARAWLDDSPGNGRAPALTLMTWTPGNTVFVAGSLAVIRIFHSPSMLVSVCQRPSRSTTRNRWCGGVRSSMYSYQPGP